MIPMDPHRGIKRSWTPYRHKPLIPCSCERYMNEDTAEATKVIRGDAHAYVRLHLQLDSTEENRVVPQFILGKDIPRGNSDIGSVRRGSVRNVTILTGSDQGLRFHYRVVLR